jgi:hypothetical protein
MLLYLEIIVIAVILFMLHSININIDKINIRYDEFRNSINNLYELIQTNYNKIRRINNDIIYNMEILNSTVYDNKDKVDAIIENYNVKINDMDEDIKINKNIFIQMNNETQVSINKIANELIMDKTLKSM